MKTSDVIIKWRRAESWVKFVFFIFSFIFHIFFVYYFYTAKFDICEIKGKKEIIEIFPISKENIVFPHTPAYSKTSSVYKPGAKKISQKLPEGRGKRLPGIKGSVAPGKKSLTGKIAGIKKEPGYTKESLKAPFNPYHYLRPETMEEIFRRIKKEKIEKNGGSVDFQDGSLGTLASGDGTTVGYGGQGYYESKGYNIKPWAKKVVVRINENWIILPGFKTDANAVVGIAVIFEKNGQIASAEIKRSSEIQHLDQAALNAINLSAPFPHLPDQFPQDQLTAFFLFSYEKE